ncbi:hypothetical protein FS837_005923 [Tulasnella sp. UAMH 9824]|nr:hypothetical protein FS837_005923 [Tulasnella sp. UAMH 9824]
MSDTTRRDALQLWDNTLHSLGQAVKLYGDSTVALFTHFDGESRSTSHGDLPTEDALLHIDKRLATIEQLEAELHGMRIAVQGLRNTSTKLSPVTRLPPEILAYIITIGADEDRLVMEAKEALMDEDSDEDDEDMAPDPPHFPTLVSHLWTRIDFREGPPFEKSKEWLNRSEDCQIEVVFDFLEDSTQLEENEPVMAALDILQPHGARISRLLIRMNTLDEMATIIGRLTSGDQTLPLKALGLSVDEADGDLLARESLRSRAGTLKTILEGLEELELDRVHIPWNLVSFRGLKILKLQSLEKPESPTPQQLHAILSASPNLEVFEIYDSDLEGSYERNELSPIVFPKLQSLKLSLMDSTTTQFAFQLITAPNLAILRADSFDISGGSSLDAGKLLPAFFSRIEPTSLRVLHIIQDELTDSDFLAILSASPGLEEIHFGDNTVISPQLLKWLAGKVDGASACPNLKTLKLDSCSGITSDSVKKLVKARQTAGRPLQTLSLKYCGLDEEGLEEWLQARVPKVTLEDDSDEEEDNDEGDLDDLELGMTDEEGPDVPMPDGELW